MLERDQIASIISPGRDTEQLIAPSVKPGGLHVEDELARRIDVSSEGFDLRFSVRDDVVVRPLENTNGRRNRFGRCFLCFERALHLPDRRSVLLRVEQSFQGLPQLANCLGPP